MKRPIAQRLAAAKRLEQRWAQTLDRAREKLARANKRGDLARIADAEQRVDRAREYWSRASRKRRSLEAKMSPGLDRAAERMERKIAAGAPKLEDGRRQEAKRIKGAKRQVAAKTERKETPRKPLSHRTNKRGKPVPYVVPEETRIPKPLVVPTVPDRGDTVPGQVQESPARAFLRLLRPWEADQVSTAAAPPKEWYPELVADRLVEAFDALARTPMPTGPAGTKTVWPAYALDAGDKAGQLVSGVAQAALDKPLPGVSIDEIARRDEALSWAMELLRDDPQAARAVQVWAIRSARGHRELLPEKQVGMKRRTAWRARARGLAAIANALNALGRIPR